MVGLKVLLLVNAIEPPGCESAKLGLELGVESNSVTGVVWLGDDLINANKIVVVT